MAATKRAYSDAQKQERETQIILAAERLLLDHGYYAINMDQIARASGLAKGTVYLYFKTKEELFLKIFERQSALWRDDIEAGLMTVAPTRAGLIDLLVRTTVAKPSFTRLVALAPIIFEYNISSERLRENKLWTYGSMYQLGERLESMFGLAPMRGAQLLLRMFVMVAGLEGFAHPSPIAQEIYDSEPTLPRLDFETELTALLQMLMDVS